MYNFIVIFITSGSQINTNSSDSRANNNIHIELSSSYQFKIQSADLAKLKLIQATRNDKKNARFFAAMGLRIKAGNKSSKKFLSKQAKAKSCTKDKVNVTPGTKKYFYNIEVSLSFFNFFSHIK